jgi:hypothetical protein
MAGWLVLLLWLSPLPLAAPAPEAEPPKPAAPPREAERVIRYAVAGRGVSARRFREDAAAVLAHSRGWSLGGRVQFRQVRRNAHFRLYLAAPDQLPALGCWDTNYSCRAGDRVVINARRWKSGVPSWGESLRDYRTMVINHEVGHWLGFGHRDCVAAGRPAPVMMQQSKGTGACLENPWPLADERAEIRRRLKTSWRP